MRIISRRVWSEQVKCKTCTSELEIEQEDVEKRRDCEGGISRNIFGWTCVVCLTWNQRIGLPEPVQIRAMERAATAMVADLGGVSGASLRAIAAGATNMSAPTGTPAAQPRGDQCGKCDDWRCECPPNRRCVCSRCSREPEEEKFHCCSSHQDSSDIAVRHRKIRGHDIVWEPV